MRELHVLALGAALAMMMGGACKRRPPTERPAPTMADNPAPDGAQAVAATETTPAFPDLYRAISAGALDAAGRKLTDDVEWGCAGCADPPARGREQVMARFGALRAALPDLELTIRRQLRAGAERFVYEAVVRGTHTGAAFAGRPARGAAVGYEELLLVHTRGGYVARVTAYGNRSALAMQIAPSEGTVAPPQPATPGALVQVTAPADPAAQRRVAAFFDGLARGDKDVFAANCHPDVLTRVPADGRELAGIAAQEEALREMRRAFPDLTVVVESTLAAGRYVVGEYRYRGTHRGPLGALAATGQTIDLRAADVFELEGDRIKAVTTYVDSGELLRQLGMEAEAPAR